MPFKLGVSGNPAGRPPVNFEVRTLAREATTVAVKTLIEVMTDSHERGSARVAAAQALLDRGWGRPDVTPPERVIDMDVKRMSDEELLRIIHRAEMMMDQMEAGAIAPPQGT